MDITKQHLLYALAILILASAIGVVDWKRTVTKQQINEYTAEYLNSTDPVRKAELKQDITTLLGSRMLARNSKADVDPFDQFLAEVEACINWAYDAAYRPRSVWEDFDEAFAYCEQNPGVAWY